MPIQIVHFLAIVFLTLLFAPAAAHAFALFNKIHMNQEQYYVAQLAYRRWDVLGWSYLGAFVFTIWLTFGLRGTGAAFWLSGAAVALTILSLVIFFIWVMPGNTATKNWTTAPQNWEQLRTNWEYGHAGSAISTFLALCATAAAATFARGDA